MLKRNGNGITVKDLKEFISDWPEEDEYGEPYEVWLESGQGLISPCRLVCRLNRNDLLLEYSWDE